MVFKNICILVHWTEVVLALGGLFRPRKIGGWSGEYLFYYSFVQKMFYACFMLIGSLENVTNFMVGIFLSNNLLG